MLPELAARDPAIVALGLPPSLAERIAMVLMLRYEGDEAIGGYFNGGPGEMVLVDSQALLKRDGFNPAPSFYMALMGIVEKLLMSGAALQTSYWGIALVLPARATTRGFGGISRVALAERLRSLTLGENVGSLENDDDPGNPLTERLVEWARVDPDEPVADNGALITTIGFSFESTINATTREVG